jgi:hypothetical protein
MKNQPLAGSSLRACFLCDLGGFSLRALRSKALNRQVREGSREGREENPEDLENRAATLSFVVSTSTGDLKMPGFICGQNFSREH